MYMYMYMYRSWQEGGGVLTDRCPDAQNICSVRSVGRRGWEKLCLPITATCILPSFQWCMRVSVAARATNASATLKFAEPSPDLLHEESSYN